MVTWALRKVWLVCLACLAVGGVGLQAYSKPQPSALTSPAFQSPVDYEISLAGNFGEPRPHHFHGGLDIRTDGVEGKHIYAIGDGYVSRVTVGLYGFGNAVYITHPTGHTSVYCHLKGFSPRIQAALRRYQYRHQTSVADARLTPLDVPVSQGQFIALSGNTGHSTAPHLHLEVHDTRTWDMLDPYEFLNDCITDTVPPLAHGFMACPQDRDSRFNGSSANSLFSTHGSQPLTAWGRVGFALWADDYMQGSHHHYGVRETILMVDGREAFHSVVNRVPVAQNRMVNSWGDYQRWRRSHVWYMRSYAEPGNTLPILLTDENRGIISFDEERDYQLEYILRDYKGNESRYAFRVKGSPTPLPAKAEGGLSRPATDASVNTKLATLTLGGAGGGYLHWNRTNSLSLPGMQLVVPYGLLAADAAIRLIVSRQPDGYSDAYSFADASLPLMADAELSLYVVRKMAPDVTSVELDTSKFYIADENGRYMGGTYQDGWVTGRVRELAGRYQLAYDDTPPTVQPVRLGERTVLNVTDAGSGIATWTATLDGRFVVFDALEKSVAYACDLLQSPIRPTGQPRRLVFTVTDNRQNTQTYETDIVY